MEAPPNPNPTSHSHRILREQDELPGGPRQLHCRLDH